MAGITRVASIVGTGNPDGGLAIDISSLALQDGDLLVVAFSTSSLAGDYTATGNNRGTYTEVAEISSDDNADTHLYAGVRRQFAPFDTSVTINSGVGSGTGTAVYAILQYRGAYASDTPYDATATTATGINSGTPDAPAITPVSPGAKIVAIYAAGNTSVSDWTAPANLSGFVQQKSSLRIIGVGDADWTSGAFDPAPVTGGTTGTLASWAAITIALKPTVTSVSVAVNNAASGHSATSPVVSSRASVTASNAAHAHAASSPAISSAAITVVPAIALHDHLASSPGIIARALIMPDSSLLQHWAGSPEIGALDRGTILRGRRRRRGGFNDYGVYRLTQN